MKGLKRAGSALLTVMGIPPSLPERIEFGRWNGLGWALFALVVLLVPFQFVFESASNRLHASQPMLMYGLNALLLMIDVPVAWAAWKRVRWTSSLRTQWRIVVVVWAMLAFFFLMEARIAFESDDRWFPKTALMLVIPLMLLQISFGRKRLPGHAPPRKHEVQVDLPNLGG